MKKLIAMLLILALALPAAAIADYSSRLCMTMEEYMAKYNSVTAPLGSPYQKLSIPYQWTKYNEYSVAWFQPAKDSSVIILLLSKDPSCTNNLSCGLDMVQICTNNSKDFIDLVSITARSGEPLSSSLFGVSISDMRVGQLLRYYYDNGYKGSGSSAYWSIDEDNKIVLEFFEAEGWYYFQICTQEDA